MLAPPYGSSWLDGTLAGPSTATVEAFYDGEGQREESTNQLTAARERHNALGDTLDQAAEAFAPLLDDFRDQVLYLGYDLSPEAIADPSEETADFNTLATDTVAKVKTMLEGTGDVDSPLGDADDDEG